MADGRRFLARGNLLSSVVVVLAATGLIAAALEAEGYRTPELELHDAGVWLSRGNDVGRLNAQIKEVDVSIVFDRNFDLLQHDDIVWVADKKGALCSVDGKVAKVTKGIDLPEESQVSLGGPTSGAATGAVLKGDKLWIAPDEGLFALGFPAATSCQSQPGPSPSPPKQDAPEPTRAVKGASQLVVGVDGTAWAFSLGGGRVVGFDSTGAKVGEERLSGTNTSDDTVQVSAVGSVPVLLNVAKGTLHIPGADPVVLAPKEVGGGLVLQLPGPERDQVLLASDLGLIEVPLDGGPPVLTGRGGSSVPARPLYLSGCAYGAWGGEPTYEVACAGRSPDRGKLSTNFEGPLLIRTNRGKVVINQPVTGAAVLLGEGTPEEVNWENAVLTPKDSDDSDDPALSNPKSVEEQVAPVAVDDTESGKHGGKKDAFATRPGQPVVVYPMRNDYDNNKADVLVIQELQDTDKCGCLQIVEGGLAVQVTPSLESSDDIHFGYTINDGQDDASAKAVVEIHPEGENGLPYLSKDQVTTVVSGGTVTHNVLADARDPDGDSMALLVPVPSPAADGSQGTVTAAVNGSITFQAPGGTKEKPYTGVSTVLFKISDGTPNASGTSNGTSKGTAVEGTLTVTVIAKPSNPPILRGDHAVAVVGHEVVIDVLANDSDADGEALRVTYPGSSETARVTQDGQDRIHVIPSQSGPLILTYSAADDTGNVETAKIRIDVLPDTGPVGPVAVRDDLVLPAGDVAVIADVLVNDTDANGDVLVVLGVKVEATEGLAVEVLDHRFLRVRATRALTRPVVFTYTITDGKYEDTAALVVRPGPDATPQPPTAVDDSVRVRAGAIAAFDVLANDTDPEGAALSIASIDPTGLPEDLKTAVFAQDGKIRFAGPKTVPAAPVTFTYTTIDPTGRTDNASIAVTVIPDDGQTNDPPEPLELTARTVAGVPVVIPIPVSAIDPDGDDVTLLGLADLAGAAPQHGSITEVGNDRLTYVPDLWDGGFYGTDQFTYQVRDAKGLPALAVVRVGVAAPPAENHPPVAIEDKRQASPDGLTIDVLRNDSDPDDDKLKLVADSVKAPEGVDWTVKATDDNRVKFEPKNLRTGQAVFTYEVSDGILRSQSRVTVTIAEVVLLPPIALDDRHPATEAGKPVRIDVLANDMDPDGTRDQLTITKIELVAGLEAVPAGTNPVRFTMPAADVVLRYTITDGGRLAEAVIRVRHAAPGKIYPPTAKYDEAKTTEGTAVAIEVLGNDTVMPGRVPQLLEVTAREHGTCRKIGAGTVEYTPKEGFSGRGGCSYVLGDGPGDRPETLKATGTVGVVVKRSSNAPPRFVTQTVRIFAKDSLDVPLRPAVVDLDDPKQSQDVTLGQPTGAPEGLKASMDGTTLRLETASKITEGNFPLTFTVSDGTAESAQLGIVNVIISSFTGPLASLGADEIETYENLPSTSYNVLANDLNLGELSDESLKVISSTQPEGGKVEVAESGLVTFKPKDNYNGLSSFDYVVDDSTGVEARQVTARVSVNVIGYPDPPAPPSLQPLNGAVQLSWGPPADNGAPITSYVVLASDGTRKESSGTSFRFDGLTNGTAYTFRIGALNRANKDTVREPDFSVPSGSVIPDIAPNTPLAPTAKFVSSGNAIDVTWVAPDSNGQAIDTYILEVTGGQKIEIEAPATTSRVEGLSNGFEYQFRVMAQKTVTDSTSKRVLESFFSGWSATEIPAKPPDAPAKPTTTPNDGTITVEWTKPNINGDEISLYYVEYFVGGKSEGPRKEVSPGSLPKIQTDIETDNYKEYTFKVAARNKAGTGPQSEASDPRNSSGRPGTVTNISSATEEDSASTLTFTAAKPNGSPILGYEYSSNNGVDWQSVSAWNGTNQVTINRLTNGTTYQFLLRAKNANGVGDTGDTVTAKSPATRPFGQPGTPVGLSGSQNSPTLTWNWSQPGLNGHNSVIRYEVSLNGGGFGSVGGATSYQVGVNPGECRTLSVRAIGDRTISPNRQTGTATGAVQACAPAPPPPVCQPWTVYGQNVWLPPGAAIRQYPDHTSPSIGSIGANQAVVVDGWTYGTTPYPGNPAPYNTNEWFHRQGGGWLSNAGVRAAPTSNNQAGGGPAASRPSECRV